MVEVISKEQAIALLDEFSKENEHTQRALCCLLGAHAGDNLGNYNEFEMSITSKELDEAMRMEGGGCHNLAPGQSTDDTEMAISMGYALLEANDLKSVETGVARVDCNLISKYYELWMQSPPFDLGMTIGAALRSNRRKNISQASTAEECAEQMLAQTSRYTAVKVNKHSQSNGGVMRISPLVVFLSRSKNENTIRRVVFGEQSLTHSSPIALDCSYVYTMACVKLIQGNSAGSVVTWIDEYFSKEESDLTVKEWWVASASIKDIKIATQSMGWIKHAITQCFIVLRRIKLFEETGVINKSALFKTQIRQVLSACGDSDTNAAIVGGLLGSYITLADFPQDYLRKIVNCDLQDNTLVHPRSAQFNPRNCIYICKRMMALPNGGTISIIDGELTEEKKNILLEKEKMINMQINKLYSTGVYSSASSVSQSIKNSNVLFSGQQAPSIASSLMPIGYHQTTFPTGLHTIHAHQQPANLYTEQVHVQEPTIESNASNISTDAQNPQTSSIETGQVPQQQSQPDTSAMNQAQTAYQDQPGETQMEAESEQDQGQILDSSISSASTDASTTDSYVIQNKLAQLVNHPGTHIQQGDKPQVNPNIENAIQEVDENVIQEEEDEEKEQKDQS